MLISFMQSRLIVMEDHTLQIIAYMHVEGRVDRFPIPTDFICNSSALGRCIRYRPSQLRAWRKADGAGVSDIFTAMHCQPVTAVSIMIDSICTAAIKLPIKPTDFFFHSSARLSDGDSQSYRTGTGIHLSRTFYLFFKVSLGCSHGCSFTESVGVVSICAKCDYHHFAKPLGGPRERHKASTVQEAA